MTDLTKPFRYVTYDVDGALTGCLYQMLQPEHVDCYIGVDESYVWTWTSYKANETRDGLELLPPAPPETPPEPPEVV